MDSRAAGLTGKTPTSEITHASTGTCVEELSTEEQSRLDLDVVYDQLALQLRKQLLREIPIELPGSKNVDLGQVQLQTSLIVSQVLNLTNRLKGEGEHLKELDCRMQSQKQETRKLDMRIEKFYKWPQQQKHRAAICLERYNDLGIRLCAGEDYRCFMDKLYTMFVFGSKPVVPLKRYRADKLCVAERLSKTRDWMCASSKFLLHHNNEVMHVLNDFATIGGMKDMPKSLTYAEFGNMLFVHDEGGEEIIHKL